MINTRNFLRNFFSGLAVLVPLIVTVGIVMGLFEFLNNFVGLQSWLGKMLQMVDFIPYISEWVIVALGYAIVILVIATVGKAATKVEEEKQVTKKIARFFEKIPVLNRIYKGIEQLWDFVFHKRTQGISQFGALVVFRLTNVYIFGLLASNKKFIMNGKEHVMIFMPSSPIPATGFNYMVPIEDVYYCDISLEDFAKVHFSLGVLSTDIFPDDFGLREFNKGKPSARKNKKKTEDSEKKEKLTLGKLKETLFRKE